MAASKAEKLRREVFLSPRLRRGLDARQLETGAAIAPQIVLAITAEIARAPEDTARAALMEFEEAEDRFPIYAPRALWDALHERKSATGVNLETIIHIALLRWIGVEPTQPAVEAAQSASHDELRALVREEMREGLGAIRETIKADLHAELVASLSPPPFALGKLLLGQLGEWGKPQGTRYRMGGEANAGPWRDITDRPPDEWISDFELLEWERDNDLMLRITKEARDGECLLGDDIWPGDILHFRCGLAPQNGDIVVAVGYDVDRQVFGTIKHWYMASPGCIELRSSNPACDTITAFQDQVEIHGVLENHIRRNFRARASSHRAVPTASARRPGKSGPPKVISLQNAA